MSGRDVMLRSASGSITSVPRCSSVNLAEAGTSGRGEGLRLDAVRSETVTVAVRAVVVAAAGSDGTESVRLTGAAGVALVNSATGVLDVDGGRDGRLDACLEGTMWSDTLLFLKLGRIR